MTKFVGDSKKTAAGRSSASMSGKERKKNMERFKSTGEHPYIQTTIQDVSSSALTPLPPVDLNRAHVFMDMKYGLKALPRVVVELFDDRCPSATTAFRNRCLEVRPEAGPICWRISQHDAHVTAVTGNDSMLLASCTALRSETEPTPAAGPAHAQGDADTQTASYIRHVWRQDRQAAGPAHHRRQHQ